MTGWSPATAARAEAILARYPDRRSAVMPLLYLAMLEDGALTTAGMRTVAGFTGLTPVQVEAVASFYTMYQGAPLGRYLISVCTAISCMLNGADEVFAAVEAETGAHDGETDQDGTFTVEHVECIGACGGAPAAQVNYEMVEGLDPGRARSLCRWLRESSPRLIVADELQELFGGRRSFPAGPPDPEGAIAPVPAWGPYGSAGRPS